LIERKIPTKGVSKEAHCKDGSNRQIRQRLQIIENLKKELKNSAK